MADKAVAAVILAPFREEHKHVRCGGTYLAHSPSEIVPDEGECPVCTRVLGIYKATHGKQNVASAGTPLAIQTGLEVSIGKPGPVEGGPDAAALSSIS